MATVLLVHGGWHAGWCWDRLVPLLERAGHRALAPDLPGHGTDRAALHDRSWERYVPTIVDLARAQPEPVILVGHSSGGMIVSEVARQAPDRVAALVYLTAFLLPPGSTPRDAIREDDGSLLREAMVVDPGAGVTTIRPEMARAVFYHDCGDEVVAWALERLQPEPLIPHGAGAEEPGEAAEPAVRRVYVETRQDRALPLAAQRRMCAAIPCDAVYSLETSHSPFLSTPEELAGILAAVAGK